MAKARKKVTTRRRAPAEPTLRERWSDPSWREAWVEGLGQSLDGVHFLDRDLELGGGLRAELVGVDASGRLVLIRLAGGEPTEDLAAALELLTFARRHAALLARHLGDPRVLPERPARLVLVLDEGDEPAAPRFEGLVELGLELLLLRTVKSAAREGAYLVPAGPVEGAGVALLGGGREAFLAAFEPDLGALAVELLEGLARLDEELHGTLTRRSATFSFRGAELLRLANRAGRLEAALAPSFQTGLVEGPEDVAHLLDDTMEALLARVGPAGSFHDPGEGPFAGDRGPSGGSSGGGPSREWEETEPLLTPEEIQALRG